MDVSKINILVPFLEVNEVAAFIFLAQKLSEKLADEPNIRIESKKPTAPQRAGSKKVVAGPEGV